MKKTAFIFLLVLLFCTPANAQGIDTVLVKIFESEPGTRLSAIFTDGFESGDTSLLDADGNGTPDLILMREDNDGILQDLRVVDLVSGTTLWQVQDVPQTLGVIDSLNIAFYGFANVVGGVEPEAIFPSEQDVLLINLSDNSPAWSYASAVRDTSTAISLVGVADLTGDDFPELILYLPETQQVQVWSAKK